MSMGCQQGGSCAGTIDVTALFKRLAGKAKQTVKIPLSCFVAEGANLSKIETLFSIATHDVFTAAFTNIQVVGEAAKDADAQNCGGTK